MTITPLYPNEAPFGLSAYYPEKSVRFVHIPAGVREAGFHNPPVKLLAVWLDGYVEFETSDQRGDAFRLERQFSSRTRTGRDTSRAIPRRDKISS